MATASPEAKDLLNSAMRLLKKLEKHCDGADERFKKKIESLKSQLQEFVSNYKTKTIDITRIKNFVKHLEELDAMCKTSANKKNEMLCLAEKDLGISSETKGNDRALEDSLKEINAKLCKLDEKLDQTAQKIDQHTMKTSQQGTSCKTVALSTQDHAVVSLLKLYKRGPKIIRKAVNAVSVFFSGGLAALKAFSNRKSDEERTTHLKINITRKNMSKFYVEQHESCLENL